MTMTEFWKRFEEINRLIKIKKILVIYPELDLEGYR